MNVPVHRDRHLKISHLFLLVTGAAVAFWAWTPLLDEGEYRDPDYWYALAVALLGGFALVGVPLLLWQRRWDRRRWGPGRILWFASGAATWLLWPPIVVARISQMGGEGAVEWSYFCGPPLMALWVMLALVAGRWLRKNRRKAKPLPWSERFGLLLGFLWATLGLYSLYMIYREEWPLW